PPRRRARQGVRAGRRGVSLLVVLAVSAAAAASAGYFASRKRKVDGDDHGHEPPPKGTKQAARASGAAKKKPAAVDPFATLPLALGDVVVGDGDERWLAGAVLAREEGRVVGALFVAPEGAKELAVAAFPSPRKDVLWLAPTSVDTPGEPPATLEVDGVALQRRGRLPVAFERMGQGAPGVGEDGMWAVYDGGGRDVALVVTSGGRSFAYAGRRLDEGEYDRLGKGE
ncbi:MAG TPA: hypothetical protein VHB21_02190, partial [Minicystis sp.]|nr:hypothetical protein [Minicystis sp.]